MAKPASLQTVIDENLGGLYDQVGGQGALWSAEAIAVDGWQLQGVRKGTGLPSRIYIEGDGRAYITRDTPSGDPTPVNAVGLKLAMHDKGQNVLYVARPCQWVRGAECADRTLWTEKRFTKAVIDKYVALVERESVGLPVELVGYSGGAWVALQVAARVPNVSKVTTIAGNLTPDWVNEQHKVTKMEVVKYPPFEREVPVVAYVGRDDSVVGRGVIDAFEAVTGVKVEVREVQAGHGKGWDGLRLP